MHFAGLKAVAESVEKPIDYYENNISGTISVLKAMQQNNIKKIVFFFIKLLNVITSLRCLTLNTRLTNC